MNRKTGQVVINLFLTDSLYHCTSRSPLAKSCLSLRTKRKRPTQDCTTAIKKDKERMITWVKGKYHMIIVLAYRDFLQHFKIPSSYTNLHIVPNLYDFHSSKECKRRHLEEYAGCSFTMNGD